MITHRGYSSNNRSIRAGIDRAYISLTSQSYGFRSPQTREAMNPDLGIAGHNGVPCSKWCRHDRLPGYPSTSKLENRTDAQWLRMTSRRNEILFSPVVRKARLGGGGDGGKKSFLLILFCLSALMSANMRRHVPDTGLVFSLLFDLLNLTLTWVTARAMSETWSERSARGVLLRH